MCINHNKTIKLLLLLVGLAEMKCVTVCSGPEGKKLDLNERCKKRASSLHMLNVKCYPHSLQLSSYKQTQPGARLPG